MVSAPGPEDRQTFLNRCLLEGDSDLEKRTRRLKRRAILISILLQVLIVSALLLIPLLGKSENIARRVVIYPSVPYARGGHPHHTAQQNPVRQHRIANGFFQPRSIPAGIVTHDSHPAQPPTDDVTDDSDVARFTVGDGSGTGVPFAGSTHAPKPPEQPPAAVKPATIRRSEGVQMAMLIHRVEPTYPILAIQTRREGRVELRAIISTDGSVQSLEIISGDPLFIQSALAAVHDWRYRPTILNGQPVEVDTHITVIYTLSH